MKKCSELVAQKLIIRYYKNLQDLVIFFKNNCSEKYINLVIEKQKKNFKVKGHTLELFKHLNLTITLKAKDEEEIKNLSHPK